MYIPQDAPTNSYKSNTFCNVAHISVVRPWPGPVQAQQLSNLQAVISGQTLLSRNFYHLPFNKYGRRASIDSTMHSFNFGSCRLHTCM